MPPRGYHKPRPVIELTPEELRLDELLRAVYGHGLSPAMRHNHDHQEGAE